MITRLEALDAQVAAHEVELAERDAAIALRDARIAALEAEVTELRATLIDHEATVLDARRRRNVESKPIESTPFPIGTPEARGEADRLLAEGVERYRAGDKHGSAMCFQKGLLLVPDHPQIHRALKRYT